MSTASVDAWKQRQAELEQLPQYPSKLRPEHIHIGNFVQYTDPRPESERDCPAYIYDVHSNSGFSRIHVLFLDTLEKDTEGVPFHEIGIKPGATFSQRRSFMRATSREKAVAYVERKYRELYKIDRAKAVHYHDEAESYGLI